MDSKLFTNLSNTLSPSFKVLFVCLVSLQISSFSIGGTLAAWQVAVTIPDNTVSTAGLTQTSAMTVVRPADMATSFLDVFADPTSWFFYNDENDTIDSSLGSFVAGPGTPPLGIGSAQISVTGTQRRNLATYQFSGTKLASITTLSFTTYNPSVGNGGSANRSAYINFNVTFDGVDTWQRRLFFVPANNGAVVQDAWQSWDAIDNGDALWGWSGFAANGNQWPDGDTNALRTWGDLLTAFPDIAVRTTDSWFGLRVGEPYANGYTENIDSLTIGIISGFTEHTVTFDFEPTPVVDTTETITVSPSDMGNWAFAPENTVGGQSGQFVTGPDTAPLGDGSAQLVLTASNEGQILVTNTYAGTRLDSITELKYSTYRTAGGAAQAPALSFEFDNDVTDADNDWRGRLTYEPYHTQTVSTGVWQEWDALDDAAGSGTGAWWGSPNALSTLDDNCPQSNPCTWAEILALYPNAGIRDTGSPFAGLLLFKAGSGWATFDGNVDNFVIGIDTGAGVHTTTYDFEPDAVAPPFVPSAGDVVINEIMWMGSDGDANDEWLELRNMTSETIDLTDWTIENAGIGTPGIITLTGTIDPNGFFLISRKAVVDSALADTVIIDQIATLSLANGGEVLTLRLPDDTVIDATPVGAWAAGINGTLKQSMERNAIPGDGTLASSWHTCIDVGCTATTFWDVVGNNYGTPRAANLSENDPTSPDYIDPDQPHTTGGSNASHDADIDPTLLDDDQVEPILDEDEDVSEDTDELLDDENVHDESEFEDVEESISLIDEELDTQAEIVTETNEEEIADVQADDVNNGSEGETTDEKEEDIEESTNVQDEYVSEYENEPAPELIDTEQVDVVETANDDAIKDEAPLSDTE